MTRSAVRSRSAPPPAFAKALNQNQFCLNATFERHNGFPQSVPQTVSPAVHSALRKLTQPLPVKTTALERAMHLTLRITGERHDRTNQELAGLARPRHVSLSTITARDQLRSWSMAIANCWMRSRRARRTTTSRRLSRSKLKLRRVKRTAASPSFDARRISVWLVERQPSAWMACCQFRSSSVRLEQASSACSSTRRRVASCQT